MTSIKFIIKFPETETTYETEWMATIDKQGFQQTQKRVGGRVAHTEHGNKSVEDVLQEARRWFGESLPPYTVETQETRFQQREQDLIEELTSPVNKEDVLDIQTRIQAIASVLPWGASPVSDFSKRILDQPNHPIRLASEKASGFCWHNWHGLGYTYKAKAMKKDQLASQLDALFAILGK